MEFICLNIMILYVRYDEIIYYNKMILININRFLKMKLKYEGGIVFGFVMEKNIKII